MVNSMTGFATGQGDADDFTWSWELRSVNGRGLDLRLRVPDWLPGFEQKLRAALSDRLSRGSVTLNLRLSRSEGNGQSRLVPAALMALIANLAEAEKHAGDAGLTLAPVTAADLISWRGVMDATPDATDPEALAKAILADFPAVVESFLQMRADEGVALEGVIKDQLDQIETLTGTAALQARERQPGQARALGVALERILQNSDGVDESRLTQELALLAVKTDVTEEIDRLKAHVTAARALLDHNGPSGRKFDFLMQEFMREANTLCSKSQDKTLTATGLDLKAVIDQMREQIQNVE